tara:strand:- start:673 stop:882 length:210 start_codon:yes stop_codon:yes gene_type:complete
MRVIKTNSILGNIQVESCTMCASDLIEFVSTNINEGYWICDECFFTYSINDENIAPGIGVILNEKIDKI